QGLLDERKKAIDKFLRTMPEVIFNWTITLALDFLRNAHQRDTGTLLNGELCGLALNLYLHEDGSEDYPGAEEEAIRIIQRLARLVLLEEQRRAGAFVWINKYSILSRVDDDFPPRLPVVDRRTCH